MLEMDTDKDFFISYNKADREWAEWIAWQLEEEIPGEENCRCESVNCVAQMQLLLHLQGGEAHVDAIKVGDYVEQKEERKQPPK